MANTPDRQLLKITSALKNVQLCTDFYTGAVKVMANREYLPLWVGESEASYRIRLISTPFPNMFAPIVTGVSGLITKKEPVVKNINSLNFENVDKKGNNLTTFIKQVCERSIVAGVDFVAVESDVETNEVYFKQYKYEDLMSYVIENDVLTQIVFREKLEKQKDRFGLEELERYIVFKIGGGEVWYKSGTQGVSLQSEWINSLNVIPVAAIQTGKTLSDFEIVPRLYDIALLNKVALNLESELANVLSVIGNPVPIFYGDYQEDGVQIGVKDALVFTDRQTEGFEYAEITGSGVDKLTEKIKSVSEMVDKLSFNVLQKSENRTVIDAQESHSKNTSFMTDVAVELENKFNLLIGWMAELSNKTLPADAKIEFKKDFDDVIFSDSQLDLLHKLVLAGDLSRNTLWEKMKIANILPKDFDAEEEAERLE